MLTLDDLFGCICLPYRSGHRPCIETAWVMPMGGHADMPYSHSKSMKMYFPRTAEDARDCTYTFTTAERMG